MSCGSEAAGALKMPWVDTCLVFISEVLATPLDSPQMTFILLLTFLKMAGESDHYTSNLRLLYADKLLAQNEIVIPLNAPVFPTYEPIKESEWDTSYTAPQCISSNKVV